MCEKQGFIPRYYIATPADVVDQTLADLQKYTRRLIEDEMGLGEQIEEATKKLLEAQANENKIDDDEDMEDEINVEDYDEFNEMLDEQEAMDIEEARKMIAGGDE